MLLNNWVGLRWFPLLYALRGLMIVAYTASTHSIAMQVDRQVCPREHSVHTFLSAMIVKGITTPRVVYGWVFLGGVYLLFSPGLSPTARDRSHQGKFRHMLRPLPYTSGRWSFAHEKNVWPLLRCTLAKLDMLTRGETLISSEPRTPWGLVLFWQLTLTYAHGTQSLSGP